MILRCRFIPLILLIAVGTTSACMPDGPGFTGMRESGPRAGYAEPGALRRLRASKAGQPTDRLSAYDAWFQKRSLGASTSEQARLIEEHDALRDILQGNYDRAITKLLAIEGAHPGLETTAGALGTAYERTGDYESALRWINSAITRDAEAHRGSEWLHARVLQARMALKDDPRHLAHSPIVPLSQSGLPLDGSAYFPSTRMLTRDDLIDALYYQLGEQMLFVKPEDPIVADLLQSLARLEAITNSTVATDACRALAREYSLNSEEALEAIPPFTSDQFDTRPLAWGVVIVIIAFGVVLRYRIEQR